nr:unnamed protein product [Digitaria exilis]
MDDGYYLSGKVFHGNMDRTIYETDDPITTVRKKTHVLLLTQQDIHQRLTQEVSATAELLCVPADWALALLSHYRWDPLRLHEEWFADPDRVRDAVGLAAGDVVPGADVQAACGVCADFKPAAEMLSAGCAHLYCQDCWRGYLASELDGSGPRCLTLRCPEPSCRRAVLRGTVERITAGEDAAYARAVARAYVDARRLWLTPCTATAGCGCAAEVPAGDEDDGDVACRCGGAFCSRCGGAPHWPAGCDAAARWALDADKASSDWILLHTKRCPRCHRPIERVGGCDVIECAEPCGHSFCWVCLGPVNVEDAWGRCAHELRPSPETEEEQRRAKRELELFLQYQDLWMWNLSKRRAAEDELRKVRGGRLPAARYGTPEKRTLEVVAAAWEEVAEGRRVVGNTCAHGQNLRRADAARWELFEFQHRRVDAVLDALEERAAKGKAPEEETKVFGAKLAALTRTARHGVECFAKAVEEGVPEEEEAAPAPSSKRQRREEASGDQ